LVAALVYVAIQRVVTGVELCSRKPPIEGGVRVVEDAVPSLHPIDVLGDFAPEAFRVSE
jgi:hypothetical protein